MFDKVTPAEIRAHLLIWGKYGKGGSTDQSFSDYHDAADEIIRLAEQIKSERQTSAMKDSAKLKLERKR